MGHYTTVSSTHKTLVSHTFHSVHTYVRNEKKGYIVNEPITVVM